MNKIILILTLLLIQAVAFAQTKEQKSFYNNGNIFTTGQHNERDERVGKWKCYYESGQLMSDENYKNGAYIGKRKSYHENGKLPVAEYYNDNGKLTSKWKAYHENGQLCVTGYYDDGKMTGNWQWYHQSGKPKTIGKYKDGESTGVWKYYDENGKLYNEGDYDPEHLLKWGKKTPKKIQA